MSILALNVVASLAARGERLTWDESLRAGLIFSALERKYRPVRGLERLKNSLRDELAEATCPIGVPVADA
jgi:hypothetical protein